MKDLYIIVSNSGSLISKILNYFTKEKYVHVSIALKDDLQYNYSFGRRYLYFPFPGGFIKEDTQRRLKHFKKSIAKVYRVRVNSDQYNNLNCDINHFLLNKKNYKYNFKGLLKIRKKKIYHRNNHFLCSQFCGKLMMDNNILNFDKDYSLITPADFCNLDDLEIIFEGKTIDYFNKEHA